jgi:ABC-type microcin C transport system permease subunit YejE
MIISAVDFHLLLYLHILPSTIPQCYLKMLLMLFLVHPVLAVPNVSRAEILIHDHHQYTSLNRRICYRDVKAQVITNRSQG